MKNRISESEIFVLLAKRRRRLVLHVLQESETPLSMRTLAERIGDRECENPTAEDIQTIYLTLYHNHLAKLEGACVISYDRDGGTVRPGLNFDVLIRMLEGVNERDLPWSDG